MAIEKEFDYVVCGHIHEPKMEEKTSKKGKTMYLNSGDWVENLTSLEYNNKRWKLFKFDKNTELIDENLFEMEENLSNQFLKNVINFK